MGLKLHRVDRLPRRDRDQRGLLRQQIVTAPEHVESAEQVDIDHGLEGIGAHPQHRREEVARRPRDDDIHRAEPIADIFHRCADRTVIAHIAGQPDCAVANLCRCVRGLLRIAPEYGDFRAQLGKALGDPEVDPAGAARDKRDLAVENPVLERRCHGTLPCDAQFTNLIARLMPRPLTLGKHNSSMG